MEQEVEVNKLNTDANALLNKAQSLQELGRALMKLNSLWRDVYQRVMYYSGVYEQAETNWNLFKCMFLSMNDFIHIQQHNIIEINICYKIISVFKSNFPMGNQNIIIMCK